MGWSEYSRARIEDRVEIPETIDKFIKVAKIEIFSPCFQILH